MTDDGSGAIARRDEVLELLYWLEGEGFRDDATLAGMQRFLAHAADDVRRTLDDLVRRGEVTHDAASGQYRLTEPGRHEAARRFAAEFASMLGRGHGECSDPNCDCHTSDGGAAECHARQHEHPHSH